MTTVRVIDFETTGGTSFTDAEQDVIECGWYDLDVEMLTIVASAQQFFKPEKFEISCEARSIHHILDAWLEHSPLTSTLTDWLHSPTVDAYCAHGAEFEKMFFNPPDSRWICTSKCSRHLWPEATKHSNQALRYCLNLDLDPVLCDPPHRAAPDAYVTTYILIEQLKLATIDQLIDWTTQPRRLDKVPFGKHYGVLWTELPKDYLGWMLKNIATFEEDVAFAIRREVARRQEVHRQRTTVATVTAVV